jgi:hypothetical protein
VVVNRKNGMIICTAFCNGKKHDFRLYKEAKVMCTENIKVLSDSGYMGIKAIHSNSVIPHKKTKNNPLTDEQKMENREISKERVSNEHAIGFIKRFRIIAEKYRNRRKRFALRFNLIAGFCNFELAI